jgi:hypothetical protein
MLTCQKCGTAATIGATDCAKCGSLFSPAESEPQNSKPESVLRWWLWFSGFWAVLNVLTLGHAGLAETTPPHALSLIWSLWATSSLRLLAVVAMLKWRKWGLYVFVASSVGYSLLSIGVAQLLLPLVSAGIMWYLTKKCWSRFA